MERKLLPSALLSTFFILIFLGAQAQPYKNGIGVRLSTADAAVNNSVSYKHFLNPRTAIEGLLTISEKPAFGALVEIHQPVPSAEGLQWYYGGGGYIGFESRKDAVDRQLLGAQGVLGLDFKFPNLPLNMSLDWKPELNFIDNINFEPAALGFTMRFTFGGKKSG